MQVRVQARQTVSDCPGRFRAGKVQQVCEKRLVDHLQPEFTDQPGPGIQASFVAGEAVNDLGSASDTEPWDLMLDARLAQIHELIARFAEHDDLPEIQRLKEISKSPGLVLQEELTCPCEFGHAEKEIALTTVLVVRDDEGPSLQIELRLADSGYHSEFHPERLCIRPGASTEVRLAHWYPCRMRAISSSRVTIRSLNALNLSMGIGSSFSGPHPALGMILTSFLPALPTTSQKANLFSLMGRRPSARRGEVRGVERDEVTALDSLPRGLSTRL